MNKMVDMVAMRERVHAYVRSTFPAEVARLEELRREVTRRPLTEGEARILAGMRYGDRPVFSLESLFSDEYSGIKGLRPMTANEVSRLRSIRNDDGSPKYDIGALINPEGTYMPLTPEQAEELYDAASVPKFRPASQREANVLYCDIHSWSIRR
ncbi:hypothetical protein HYV82_05555 [Candidatus Woesearchaeota archaeon]|nr:hypothetical protein [Candidatus Woesearchaeota archaeon]